MDAGQRPVFQAKPCPVGQAQKQMRLQRAPTPVPGERASELSDARLNAQQSSQVRKPAQAFQPPTEPAPLPPCPRTYEDGASYFIGSSAPDSFELALARAQNRALPSRTYLKNAGRWPKHCP